MAAPDLTAWLLVFGMAVIAFSARSVFVLPGHRLRLPRRLEQVLRYAPAAALMAIIVPALVLSDGALSVGPTNPRFVGGLVAFAIAATTRSILLTIGGGMLALTLVRLLA